MSLMYLGTQLLNDLYTIIAVRSITLFCIGRTPAALNSGPEEVSFGLSCIILRANFWSLCMQIIYFILLYFILQSLSHDRFNPQS